MAAFQDPLFYEGFKMTTNLDMSMYERYDAFVRETAIFKADRGIQYCTTKLAGEVGEFNDKVAAHLCNQPGFTDQAFKYYLDPNDRDAMLLELGDITWYIAALSQQLGYNTMLLQGVHPASMGTMREGIIFLTLGLKMSGAVGAISERAGKVIRDQDGDGTNTDYNKHMKFQHATMHDLSTLLDMVVRLAVLLNSSLEDVINRNIGKLTSRRARNKLRGSGDNR